VNDFRNWLSRQRHRCDVVGEFAWEAFEGPYGFPDSGDSYGDWRTHLLARGAKDTELAALELAWLTFEEQSYFRRDEEARGTTGDTPGNIDAPASTHVDDAAPVHPPVGEVPSRDAEAYAMNAEIGPEPDLAGFPCSKWLLTSKSTNSWIWAA
jgi:hypothetical protein